MITVLFLNHYRTKKGFFANWENSSKNTKSEEAVFWTTIRKNSAAIAVRPYRPAQAVVRIAGVYWK